MRQFRSDLFERVVRKTRDGLKGVSLPPGFSSTDVTPAILDKLAPAIRDVFIHTYSSSIQTVFLVAVPIGLLSFFFSWLIPHVELRRAAAPENPAEIVDVDITEVR